MSVVERIDELYTFNGSTVNLPYSIASPRDVLDNPTPFFIGYGQGEASTDRILRDAGINGVNLLVPEFRFSSLKDRGAFGSRQTAVDRISREFIPHVLEELSAEFGNKRPLNTVAYSMGGMILSRGLEETDGKNTGDIVVANGMGTSTSEGDIAYRNIGAYLSKFVYAISSGTKPQEGYIKALEATTGMISRDLVAGTFIAQLRTANHASAVLPFVQHAENGNRVSIWTGSKDKLFPSGKVHEAFSEYKHLEGLSLKTIEGLPHQDAGMDKARPVIIDAALHMKK